MSIFRKKKTVENMSAVGKKETELCVISRKQYHRYE